MKASLHRKMKSSEMRKEIPKLVKEIYFPDRIPDNKIKNMWIERPEDWPPSVPFRDPNNKGSQQKKPKKEELYSMYDFLNVKWHNCQPSGDVFNINEHASDETKCPVTGEGILSENQMETNSLIQVKGGGILPDEDHRQKEPVSSRKIEHSDIVVLKEESPLSNDCNHQLNDGTIMELHQFKPGSSFPKSGPENYITNYPHEPFDMEEMEESGYALDETKIPVTVENYSESNLNENLMEKETKGLIQELEVIPEIGRDFKDLLVADDCDELPYGCRLSDWQEESCDENGKKVLKEESPESNGWNNQLNDMEFLQSETICSESGYVSDVTKIPLTAENYKENLNENQMEKETNSLIQVRGCSVCPEKRQKEPVISRKRKIEESDIVASEGILPIMIDVVSGQCNKLPCWKKSQSRRCWKNNQ